MTAGMLLSTCLFFNLFFNSRYYTCSSAKKTENILKTFYIDLFQQSNIRLDFCHSLGSSHMPTPALGLGWGGGSVGSFSKTIAVN